MDITRRQALGLGAAGLSALLGVGCRSTFSQDQESVYNPLAQPEYLAPPELRPAWGRANGIVFSPTPQRGPDIEGFKVQNDLVMSYANPQLPADTRVARMNDDNELEIRGYDFNTHRLPADQIDNIMPTAQPWFSAMMAQRHRGTGIAGHLNFSDSALDTIVNTRIYRRVGELFDGSDEVEYQVSIGCVPRGASEEIIREVTNDSALLLKNTVGWAGEHLVFAGVSGQSGVGILAYTAATAPARGLEGYRFYTQQRHTWGNKIASEAPITNPSDVWNEYVSRQTHKAMVSQLRDIDGNPHATMVMPIAVDRMNHTMPPTRGIMYFPEDPFVGAVHFAWKMKVPQRYSLAWALLGAAAAGGATHILEDLNDDCNPGQPSSGGGQGPSGPGAGFFN